MPSIVGKIPYKKLAFLATGTVVIIFILFKINVDSRAFINTIKEARIIFLWYALLTILPTFIFNPLRWFFVLKSYDYDVTFKKTFYAVTAAGAFILIPGRLGDFIRSYFIKDHVPAAESVGSVIIEKIIDVIILLIIGGIGLMLIGQTLYSAATFLVAMCVIVGVVTVKKIGPKLGLTKIAFIHKVSASLRKPEKPSYLAMAAGISMANWLSSIVSTYFLFMAFHAAVPFTAVITYLPFTTFAGLIPISLAGIGIRDGAIISLFSNYATSAQSLAVGLSYSFLGYFIFMLAGIPFVIHYFYPRKST